MGFFNGINDLIDQYNEQKVICNKININNMNKNEVKDATTKINELQEFKNQIKDYEKEEDCNINFDSEGFAAYPTAKDYNLENRNLIPLNGGGEKLNKNYRVLNSANITKAYANQEGLDLGKYVRGSLTGSWENAAAEMNEFKALSTGTGQVLIPTSLSAEILKAVMNKSLIYRSGVPVVDMPNGNITIAKVKNNPNFGFKEELVKATTSDAEFEGIDLKGKMCYGLMKVSLETLHSAKNLTEVLQQAMSDSLADAVDKAMLYGTGTTDIKGIFNHTDINTVEAIEANYISFINAVGKIRSSNGEPKVMGINADIDTKLNLLVDTTGQPLNTPKVIENLNRIVSNNLRNDLGTGTDESESIVFDPSALLIGNQVQFKFEVSRDFGFEDGSVFLRIYSLLDMAVLRAKHITRITKLK